MNMFKTASLALVAVAALSTASFANEFATGPYVGAKGVVNINTGKYDAAVNTGITGRNDVLYYGVDLELGGLSKVPNINDVQVTGRAGVVVTENLALYGLAGVQTDFKTVTPVAGVGVEIQANETVSIVGEFERNFPTNLPTYDEVKVGFKVRF